MRETDRDLNSTKVYVFRMIQTKKIESKASRGKLASFRGALLFLLLS